MEEFRKEEDSLGPVDVPREAYFGSFTARAKENFQFTGESTGRELIEALGSIKKAAARTNEALGNLEEEKAQAIRTAAEEVREGKFDEEFVLDPIQAGAGTPVHMNANEVIANRATEILGGEKGEYLVHPNDHVNMGQSSNNVVPTAVRLAALDLAEGTLREAESLREAFREKGEEFSDLLKVGRTHLQDAVPVTLGQEFKAYGELVGSGKRRIEQARKELLQVGLGGNAVGTGINTEKDFRERIVGALGEVVDRELIPARDPLAITQSMSVFAHFSGAMRALSTDLIKIADDLALLSSGPKAGLAEIELPEVEPGSSIMPGKVNPSVVEALKMICLQVLGNDETVSLAASEGDLELNVTAPLIARNIFSSLSLLKEGMKTLRRLCIEGIRANEDKLAKSFRESTATATALSPYIGYDRTAQAVDQALEEKKSVKRVVAEKGWMKESELDRILEGERLTTPSGVDRQLQKRVKARINEEG